MNIVIDTNVVISGTFFGGAPRRVLEAVVDRTISAYATAEIVDEYTEIVQEMIDRKQGHLSAAVLTLFVNRLHLVEAVTSVKASRDPDDDKFIPLVGNLMVYHSGIRISPVLPALLAQRVHQQELFYANQKLHSPAAPPPQISKTMLTHPVQ